MAEEHGYAVAGIVFSGEHERLADTVPVEVGVVKCLCIVAIGIEVGPLALTLESSGDCIVAECFLFEAHFLELGVAYHEVAHDDGHLHHEFPVGIFLLAGLALFGTVLEVIALVALGVSLGPCHCALILLVVVDTFGHAADDFREVN